jgi:hypothetical protein
MSILTKALAKGKAQPRELLIRAIKSAEAGQSKLLNTQERKLQGKGDNFFNFCSWVIWG